MALVDVMQRLDAGNKLVGLLVYKILKDSRVPWIYRIRRGSIRSSRPTIHNYSPPSVFELTFLVSAAKHSTFKTVSFNYDHEFWNTHQNVHSHPHFCLYSPLSLYSRVCFPFIHFMIFTRVHL